MATNNDNKLLDLGDKNLPEHEQERDGVDTAVNTEGDLSSSNFHNISNNLSNQWFKQFEDKGILKKAHSTTGQENNALLLAETGKALALRTKLGYNTGHGDFCFGRYSDRNDQIYDAMNYSYMPWYPLNWVEGSHAVPPANFLAYEREGTFPFFKLPREVRRRIFLLMTAPLNCYGTLQQKPIMSLELHHSTAKSSLTWEGHEECEWPFLPWGGWDTTYEAAPEIPEDEQTMMEKIKRHPNRRSPYNLTASPCRDGFKRDLNMLMHPEDDRFIEHLDPRHDWLYLEWLRKASNVSTHFRLELAQVLWSNTRIRVGGEAEEHWLLPDFLRERPAVRSGIKELDLSLSLYRLDETNPLLDDKHNFVWWCDAVSKLVKPDIISIDLVVRDEDLGQIGSGAGYYSTLSASRKLQVTKDFRVTMFIMGFEDLEGIGEEKTEEKYIALIREIMLPDCLRKGQLEMETEKDEYIRSRLDSP